MPGIGVRTGARILIDVGDGTAFHTAGHFAAYAGLVPVTRRSGSSIRGESPSRRGNEHLKRALFLAAFASLSDPAPKTCYERKKAEGKRHRQDLACTECPVTWPPVFSVQAKALYPDAEIISVQAIFKNRPIVPFSARYAEPKPKEHEKGLLATSWMDYVTGVEQ